MHRLALVTLCVGVTSLFSPADARVEHVKILDREASARHRIRAGGRYEKLYGRAWFALDANAAAIRQWPISSSHRVTIAASWNLALIF